MSESRNTICLDDAIEPLRLTHDNGIIDTTRGVGAANTIPERSPKVRGQVRTVLHLIREIRLAVPAHFHLRRPDRDQGRKFKGELPHWRICEVASGRGGRANSGEEQGRQVHLDWIAAPYSSVDLSAPRVANSSFAKFTARADDRTDTVRWRERKSSAGPNPDSERWSQSSSSAAKGSP